MFHRVTLVGRVGQAPVVRTTKTGLRMASFSAAVDINGKDKKVTVWPRVTAFGSLSDIIEKHIKKGATVLVEGRLSPDPLTGAPKVFLKKDGTWGSSYDIVAEKVQVLGKTETEPIPAAGSSSEDNIPF